VELTSSSNISVLAEYAADLAQHQQPSCAPYDGRGNHCDRDA